MAPTYRQRLRREGATLLALGLIASAVLLATREQAQRGPASTVAQLAIVAVALIAIGPRVTRGALAKAGPVDTPGDGEPTPLWHIALIAGGLTLLVAAVAGWDAGLRVTGGCALVGAYQALVIARQVGADEHRRGRRYFRMPGSRLGRGTVLGYTSA